MATLQEQLLGDDVRPQLVRDCCTLLDDEVRRKRGLKGLAIKAAYKTVKALRRGFVSGVVDALLNEWVEELEPFYTDFFSQEGATSFPRFLESRRGEVAERLLSVTDKRAETTTHKTAARAYRKLRPNAKTNVEEALPRLGAVVAKYLS